MIEGYVGFSACRKALHPPVWIWGGLHCGQRKEVSLLHALRLAFVFLKVRVKMDRT